MLVDIYEEGNDRTPESLTFAVRPQVGDRVALQGAYFEVTDTWHQPAERPFGTRFAITLRPDAATRSTRSGDREPAPPGRVEVAVSGG